MFGIVLFAVWQLIVWFGWLFVWLLFVPFWLLIFVRFSLVCCSCFGCFDFALMVVAGLVWAVELLTWMVWT